VFLFGLLLFALVYGGFVLATSPAIVYGLFFVYGIYAAATEGIAKAWITNIAHDQNTATAIGFYTSMESVSSLLASVIAGVLWSGAGSEYVFLFSAIVTIAVMMHLRKLREA
jgi:MFS family permease